MIMLYVKHAFKFLIKKVVKYRYRINNCLLCNSKNIRMSLKFFTTKLRMFNIDEKNVRNVISFEFLNFF